MHLQVRMDNTTLSGVVRSSAGTPVQAMIELSASGTFGKGVTFITDASGTFSESVQPGDYTARVTRSQDGSIALMEVSVKRNTPLEMDITLTDGRTLSGVVTASGTGVPQLMSSSPPGT